MTSARDATHSASKRREADRLYDRFRTGVINLGGEFRHLFVLKSRGLMTMKLLCTGLLCSDGQEMLRSLDAFSLEYASIDSVLVEQHEEDSVERLRQRSTAFHAMYAAFSRSFLALVDQYRGLDIWYKTPPGLCTALYLAFRLKHCTAQCVKFETRAVGLVETATSFREITPWHRWISGLPVCVQCQCSDDKKLQLCDICENAFYCSAKCKKRNAQAHRKYCHRPPTSSTVDLKIVF